MARTQAFQAVYIYFIFSANLSVDNLPFSITKLTNGVYYGCAQIIGSGIDSGIYRMVMNIGNRPTFQNGDNISLVTSCVCRMISFFYPLRTIGVIHLKFLQVLLKLILITFVIYFWTRLFRSLNVCSVLALFTVAFEQEVHILHDYEVDFYGKELRIAVLGFIREEMRFSSAGMQMVLYRC